MKARSVLAAAAWAAVPVAIYLLVLRHVGFNVPTWDDYDAMLDSPMMLMDAGGARAWLERLFALHNEHRIAFARLAAWSLAKATGHVDIRVLVLLGNLCWIGVLGLLWSELRDRIATPLYMAAAFLMLQWSYWESSMMAMAALSNMGVVLFSLASLFFAVREGRAAFALALALGALAAATQGNGLFALPIAAVGCVLLRRPRRAAAFAVVAAALWIAYSHGYERPANHPSPAVALQRPLDTVQLFLVVVGGIAPGRWLPIPVGAAMLGMLVWLTRRGTWRAHPACALWVLFVLASAGAAAVGRVGIGVYHAPRYSLYASVLAAILTLLAFERLELRRRAAVVATIAACAAISLLVTRASWADVRKYSFDARLLAEAVPMPAAAVSERYFGVLHPNPQWASRILSDAGRRGLFAPPRAVVQPSAWIMADATPARGAVAGRIESSEASGDTLRIKGWTHLPATLPGRRFTFSPAADAPLDVAVRVQPRPDIAALHARPDLLFAGFELDLRYSSAEAARRAAGHVCVAVETPQHAPAAVSGSGGDCPAP